MAFAAIVTTLALGYWGWLGYNTGMARSRYGIVPPASTGDPAFERIWGVHRNTGEALILFLPGLWMCAAFTSDWLAGILGLVWLGCRVWYRDAYLDDPARRGPPFAAGSGIAAALAIIGTLGAIFG